MNPLKQVHPKWATIGLQHSPGIALKKRPELAAIIAQCIGISAETELWLGVTLAGFLKANYAAAVAMLNSVQSRSAQIRMLRAAADSSISNQNDRDLLEAILSGAVFPAFKERDKLAHWLWGVSDSLPEDLLLMEPTADQDYLVQMVHTAEPLGLSRDHIFVVRKIDLESILKRINKAQEYIRSFNFLTDSRWGDDPKRAERRLRLTSEPPIRGALARLNDRPQSNPEAQP